MLSGKLNSKVFVTRNYLLNILSCKVSSKKLPVHKMSHKPLIYLYSSYKEDPELGVNKVYIDRLEQYFDVCTPEDLKADPSKDGVVQGAIFLPHRYDLMKPFLPFMTSLKVINTISTGIDRFPIETFKKMGVRIGNAPAFRQQNKTVANYALLLMLSLARGFRQELQFMSGNHKMNINRNISHDVTGKTLGIVGLGRIGKELALLAQALQMTILYHNRKIRDDVDNMSYHASMDTMLPECDYVAVCCPLNDHSRQLFTQHQFKLMKSTAMIINISRGKIIDTEALVNALQTGEIAGAGLDVTDPEPLPQGHPLFTLPNVIVTGHCASQTVEAKEEVWGMIIDNLRAGIEGKPLPYEVHSNI